MGVREWKKENKMKIERIKREMREMREREREREREKCLRYVEEVLVFP